MAPAFLATGQGCPRTRLPRCGTHVALKIGDRCESHAHPRWPLLRPVASPTHRAGRKGSPMGGSCRGPGWWESAPVSGWWSGYPPNTTGTAATGCLSFTAPSLSPSRMLAARVAGPSGMDRHHTHILPPSPVNRRSGGFQVFRRRASHAGSPVSANRRLVARSSVGRDSIFGPPVVRHRGSAPRAGDRHTRSSRGLSPFILVGGQILGPPLRRGFARPVLFDRVVVAFLSRDLSLAFPFSKNIVWQRRIWACGPWKKRNDWVGSVQHDCPDQKHAWSRSR